MEQDGTIILRERLVDGGLVGEAMGRVKPGDPSYDKIRRHLSGLTAGYNVPIYNNWGF